MTFKNSSPTFNQSPGASTTNVTKSQAKRPNPNLFSVDHLPDDKGSENNVFLSPDQKLNPMAGMDSVTGEEQDV